MNSDAKPGDVVIIEGIIRDVTPIMDGQTEYLIELPSQMTMGFLEDEFKLATPEVPAAAKNALNLSLVDVFNAAREHNCVVSFMVTPVTPVVES